MKRLIALRELFSSNSISLQVKKKRDTAFHCWHSITFARLFAIKVALSVNLLPLINCRVNVFESFGEVKP
jgi:hypothetical protein